MTERLYMICDGNDYHWSMQIGPFNTAAEAERELERMGWDWIMVSSRTLDEFGTVLSESVRFYKPDVRMFGRNLLNPSELTDIDELRRKLTQAVPPLNNQEIAFFAQYEDQMAEPPVHEVRDWTKDSRMGVLFRRIKAVL